MKLFILLKKSDVAPAILTKTTKEVCSQMFMDDSALVSCSTSGIIDISQLITLCELDYNASPVIKIFSLGLICLSKNHV